MHFFLIHIILPAALHWFDESQYAFKAQVAEHVEAAWHVIGPPATDSLQVDRSDMVEQSELIAQIAGKY